jgi:glutamate carboxypeptidase
VEPAKGHSAVLEAAHKTVALHGLNGKWPGVTVNVGRLEGGTRPNVVAERCTLSIDVRSPDETSMEEAEREILRIAEHSTVAGTTSRVRVSAAHRPMAKTAASARLVEMAGEIARELGFDIRDTATGGASDANTTAAAGVPTLDGLGPIGGDAHSASEWLDLSSMVPRVTLLAALLARVESEGAPRH